jgi:hypothetical protein
MVGVAESDSVEEREPRMESAVLADLQRWPAEIAGTGLAELALDAARRLDDPNLTPTPASMLHAQLRATLVELETMAAAVGVPDADGIDDLKAKRDVRRGA